MPARNVAIHARRTRRPAPRSTDFARLARIVALAPIRPPSGRQCYRRHSRLQWGGPPKAPQEALVLSGQAALVGDSAVGRSIVVASMAW
jgi:hypothetical protein